MGLDFIRAKAKRFEQQRDKSKLQELDIADLLSSAKPDKFVPLFRCQLDSLDTILVAGLILLGRAFGESSVVILQRGKKVAQMLALDAGELTRLMKLNRCHHGVISLVIVQEAGLDGVFVVKAKKPFKLRE